MRIEFLGTGGATITPRPCCECRVCVEARARGVPYSRGGPAIFVHGPDLLIDTPEDIAHTLNRAGIRQVQAATWSHWHPDHTSGCRVFETMNIRLWDWPPQHETTPVYLPAGVKEDFDAYHDLSGKLDYLEERQGTVRRHVLAEGEMFTLGEVTVQPVKLPVSTAHVYAFILTAGDKRALLVPDELVGWQPPSDLGRFDLAVLATGIFEFDPFSGERRIPTDHPVLATEATFRQTLDMVRALDTERVLFTHIEEFDGHSYDDLLRLQRTLMQEQPDLPSLMFAFDRLTLNL